MLDKYISAIENTDSVKYVGFVDRIQGNLIECRGPQAVIGEICRIFVPKGSGEIHGEVVALKGEKVQLMAYGDMYGIETGCRVVATGEQLNVRVSPELLGRVLDSRGNPMDGKGGIGSVENYPVMGPPPGPLERVPIDRQLVTGVRAIDSMIPVGCGQRMGIFAAAGVGKSTLLGMVARNTQADVNVIALIGERGMEVPRFIQRDLGEEGLARSVVICSTSDTSAVSRTKGAFTAMAVAEYFRDQGKDVLLLFDSVTRFAMAQREIGLAIGEPPATRGYPPSLLTVLPKLLERAGATEKGSITGLYTILVEGDDMDEPVADAVRGILDGHIILSRDLARRNQYPAIDVLSSVSRVDTDIQSKKMKNLMGQIRRWMAVYSDKEDLINVGAYAPGSNPDIDKAIEKMESINEFLKQPVEEKSLIKETLLEAGVIADEPLSEEDLDNETLSVFA